MSDSQRSTERSRRSLAIKLYEQRLRILKLEGELAHCENALYAAHRRIAELEHQLQKAAKRRKLRKQQAKRE